MGYQWVPANAEHSLISDGKTFHSVAGLAAQYKEALIADLTKMDIDLDQPLLIINPIYYAPSGYQTLECSVKIVYDDYGERLYDGPIKMRKPYPNKNYIQSQMTKGAKRFKNGIVFPLDNMELPHIREIVIEWTCDQYIRTISRSILNVRLQPLSTYPPADERQPAWYYLKNVDSTSRYDSLVHQTTANYITVEETEEYLEMQKRETLILLPDDSFYGVET